MTGVIGITVFACLFLPCVSRIAPAAVSATALEMPVLSRPAQGATVVVSEREVINPPYEPDGKMVRKPPDDRNYTLREMNLLDFDLENPFWDKYFREKGWESWRRDYDRLLKERKLSSTVFTPTPTRPESATGFRSSIHPDIVVTANRFRRRRAEAADTVSVVGRDAIAASGARDLGEAIERAPGVEVTRYGTPGTQSDVSIRGSRASQVLVMQDGRPLNSVATGIADTSQAESGPVDRVEIVRGPSGLLYGSSALGGVVNVLTPRPPSRLSGSLEGRTGTFGTGLVRGSVGGPVGPTRWLVADERVRTDGHRPNSGYETDRAFLKGEAFANPRLTISGGRNVSSLGVPGPAPSLDPAKRTTAQGYFGDAAVSSLTDRQDDRKYFYDAKVDWLGPEDVTISARHFYDTGKMVFNYGSFPAGNPVSQNSTIRTVVAGADGQVMVGPWMPEKVQAVAGAEWRKERLRSGLDQRDLVTGAWSGADLINAAAEIGSGYAEAGIRPLARARFPENLGFLGGLNLSGGIRHDRHSIFGAITNSHGGAALDFGRVVIKGSVGTAFRAPSLNDLFWPEDAFSAGNRALKPERGTTYEYGVERRDGRLFARVGAFERRVKDQIDWAPGGDGRWRPANVGMVTTRGEEAECSLPWGRLRLDGVLTGLRAVQVQDEVGEVDMVTGAPVVTRTERRTAAHVPRYTASASATAKCRFDSSVTFSVLRVGERVMYVSDWSNWPRVSYASKKLSPYTVVNARWSRKFSSRYEVCFGIDNLTDEKYSTRFGNDLGDRDYPMPPRTYYGGASVRW